MNITTHNENCTILRLHGSDFSAIPETITEILFFRNKKSCCERMDYFLGILLMLLKLILSLVLFN